MMIEKHIDIIPSIRLDDPDKASIARTLRATCIDIGFFKVEGHGIEPELIDAVMDESRKLFALSLESKQKLSDKVMSRGYTPMEEEALDPSSQTRGDTKEGFYIGNDIPETSPAYNPQKLRGPNQWPSREKCPDMHDPESFKEIMQTYFHRMCDLGLRVVRLLALAIGLDEHYFDFAFIDEPFASIRLLHYAAEKSLPEKGIFACGAHSDYGMITLLLTDENPGLQILTNDNEWINVPPTKGAFIVNLGDMLERWTNDLFKSTKHRVLTCGDNERYSIPFFYEPNFDVSTTFCVPSLCIASTSNKSPSLLLSFQTVVECLDVCCSESNPCKYPPTTSGQHLLGKYQQTHSDFSPKQSTQQ